MDGVEVEGGYGVVASFEKVDGRAEVISTRSGLAKGMAA